MFIKYFITFCLTVIILSACSDNNSTSPSDHAKLSASINNSTWKAKKLTLSTPDSQLRISASNSTQQIIINLPTYQFTDTTFIFGCSAHNCFASFISNDTTFSTIDQSLMLGSITLHISEENIIESSFYFNAPDQNQNIISIKDGSFTAKLP